MLIDGFRDLGESCNMEFSRGTMECYMGGRTGLILAHSDDKVLTAA